MKSLVGDLFVDDFKGLKNRYSGLDEYGELTGEVHELLRLHPLLCDLKLQDALLFDQRLRPNAAFPEGKCGRVGGHGRYDPRLLLAFGVYCCIGKRGHFYLSSFKASGWFE